MSRSLNFFLVVGKAKQNAPLLLYRYGTCYLSAKVSTNFLNLCYQQASGIALFGLNPTFLFADRVGLGEISTIPSPTSISLAPDESCQVMLPAPPRSLVEVCDSDSRMSCYTLDQPIPLFASEESQNLGVSSSEACGE